MRVSKEQMAENRERMLDVSSRLFRERGFDGIGVVDLMKGAGLTHGAFYGHFASKEELMAQVCSRALTQSLAGWERLAEAAPERPLAAIQAAYLTAQHRDQPGRGCALVALGADVSRQGPVVRSAFTVGFKSLLARLTGLMPGASAEARRQQALADYAAMVGALVLARAIDDSALSDEILAAVAASLSGHSSAA